MSEFKDASAATPISPDDTDSLQSLSADELKTRGSTKGFRSGVSSVSMQEVYEPRLERNDILDAGFTGDQGFLILNSFEGHVEPTRFRFAFDVSRDEYLLPSQLLNIKPPQGLSQLTGYYLTANYGLYQSTLSADEASACWLVTR